jgi:hypothetical protein
MFDILEKLLTFYHKLFTLVPSANKMGSDKTLLEVGHLYIL